MKLLHEPPAGFDGIARMFAMARQIPTSRQLGLKVGLACEGALYARGELDGYRQVSFFSEHVRALGYEEQLLGGEDEMFGCDLLFALPVVAVAEAKEEDPSFIRRPAMERWPARG